MKKILYLLLCACSILFSCKKEVKLREITVNDSLFQTIVVDPDDIDPKGVFNISEIATDVEYIPLETQDSVIIGGIEKLIVWNNKFFIWDRQSETIFCFDANGKFLHKINKQGQGPGEYPCINDFTVDVKNGNIHLYSDRGMAFYSYTEKGEFVKKTPHPFILTSFAVQGDFTYYYLGRLPNVNFYGETYPNQYRYVSMKNDELKHQQLKYVFNEKFLRIPLSVDNFSFYKDTLLLTEFLRPEVYMIDSLGCLQPRYRIKFLNNTYSPSFDEEPDVERIKTEEKKGNLVGLHGGFFETDNYLFFNYSRGCFGQVYVNKKDGMIHNMGYFLDDDFNHNQISILNIFADEDFLYKKAEPGLLIKNKNNFSPKLKGIVDNLDEFDNPVIVKVKLK